MKTGHQKYIVALASIGLFLFGCGQRADKHPGITISTRYLNVTDEIKDESFVISKDLYSQTTEDLNLRSEEDILFRPPFRPTVVKYSPLEEGVLGLTECEYRSDGYSHCSIKLSPVINPDTATNELQRDARKRALVGVLRHEFGHAFGMGHIKDNDKHVMYPYFKSVQLEEENVALFIEDLTNLRINGKNSGIPLIDTKQLNGEIRSSN